MIKEWLEEYRPINQDAAEQALREIMQEIALAGLQRSGFFEKAAFYGGTALRIFHRLQRFSEDLDFSLLVVNPNFSFEPYLRGIKAEFESLGVTVSVEEKNKTATTDVDSAFLKPDTTWKELIIKEILPHESVKMRPMIKIKIEVDTTPPLGFLTEEKLLLKPFSFYVKCFTLPDLFAGKMHALLFRKWKGRVKGRDWFDMEWYIRGNIPLNLDHFIKRAVDSGDWDSNEMTIAQFMSLLTYKINNVSFNSIREDVIRFIPPQDEKEIAAWSPAYFTDLIQKIKFKNDMLINEHWSIPQPLEYGKNIRVSSSHGGLIVSIFNATGNDVSKYLNPKDKQIEFYVPEIAHINPQMIRFKTETGEKDVRFEQF